MAKLTLSGLHEIRDRESAVLKLRNLQGKTVHVVVAMGTSGIEKGAKIVLNTIAEEVQKRNLDQVIITQTGSAAPSPEPLVEVFTKEQGLVVYAPVGKAEAVRIVEEHLEGGNIVKDLQIQTEA